MDARSRHGSYGWETRGGRLHAQRHTGIGDQASKGECLLYASIRHYYTAERKSGGISSISYSPRPHRQTLFRTSAHLNASGLGGGILALGLLLQALPPQPQDSEERNYATGDRDVERIPNPPHVRLQHRRDRVLSPHLLKYAPHLGGAGVDEDKGIDAEGSECGVGGDPIDETVLEQRLCNGDEDGSAEGLEELDARRGDGDII